MKRAEPDWRTLLRRFLRQDMSLDSRIIQSSSAGMVTTYRLMTARRPFTMNVVNWLALFLFFETLLSDDERNWRRLSNRLMMQLLEKPSKVLLQAGTKEQNESSATLQKKLLDAP